MEQHLNSGIEYSENLYESKILNDLRLKIENRTAVIGLIGLGYVGLPLAVAFSRKFNVIGYDINQNIVNKLKRGMSNISDVSDEEIEKYVGKSLFPTTNSVELSQCDIIIICVPTPLTDEKEPDMSYIVSSSETIAKVLRRGQFIILESTTYPGTTEELVVPILEKTGLKALQDFGVAYSPERIDPGNKDYKVENTPKVVGGLNMGCTEIAAIAYSSVLNKVIKVTDARTAEAVKMVENIFRNVNIALVNELALIFERMDIDTWEVINAASSKPYGYMAFYPGPGIGGHCIPLDPFYLSYKAKKYGFIPRFIETSGEINDFMRIHAVNLAEKGLRNAGKRIFGAKVAVLGLAYKKNISDTRESPTSKILEELVKQGAEIRVYDPCASSIRTKVGEFVSESTIEDAVRGADCALFVVDHDKFKALDLADIEIIMDTPVIVDCKNMFNFKDNDGIHLCIGKNSEY